MFKKLLKNKILYICLGLMLVLTPFVLRAISTVSAATPAGNILTEADMDANLYSKLRGILGGTVRDNSIYANNIEELDLTNTTPHTVSNANRIFSLQGLELMDMRSVKVLKVNQQALTELTATTLSGMPNLERLELADNQLTSLDLVNNNKLKYLVLDNNQIESLNLSNFNTLGYNEGNSLISLNYNNFDSISDIVLPAVTAQSKLTINAYGNNLTDVVKTTDLGFTFNLGVQGVRYFGNGDKNIITVDRPIKFYPNEATEVSAKIFKKANNEFTLLQTLSNQAPEITTVNLQVGEYKIEYYVNDLALTEEQQEAYKYCVNSQFVVQPPKPTFYFMVDGKRYDSIEKITEETVVVIKQQDNEKIYTSIDNGNWVEGNELTLTKGGKYTVSIKSTIDGYESEVVTFYVTANPNLYVSNGILILLVGLVAAVFIGVLFLIKRYVIK